MYPWEVQLVASEPSTGVVGLARSGRLEYFDGAGWRPVHLDFVEEGALAIVGAARRARRSVVIQYPVEHDLLACLVGLQIAVLDHARGTRTRLGVVTSDPERFEEQWYRLALRGFADRVEAGEALKPWVVDEVRATVGQRWARPEVLVGSRLGNSVDGFDALVLDGGVSSQAPTNGPWTVWVRCDPRDPALPSLQEAGWVVWGWSRTILQLWYEELTPASVQSCPAWQAQRLLRVLSKGQRWRIVACSDGPLEEALERTIRSAAEASRILREMDDGARLMRDVWDALWFVLSLPIRPSDYDSLAADLGYGTRTIRATTQQLERSARSLGPRAMDWVGPLLVHLEGLTAALEGSSPVERQVLALGEGADVVVVRNAPSTAAVVQSLVRARVDPMPKVTSLRLLHRLEPVRRMVVVGAPRWNAWPSLLGAAEEVVVVVPGRWTGLRVRATIVEYDNAMARWGGLECRTRAWWMITGSACPAPTLDVPDDVLPVEVDGVEVSSTSDPWEVLRDLPWDLMLPTGTLPDSEDSAEVASEDSEVSTTAGPVSALRVETDRGILFLPLDGVVEALAGGDVREVAVASLRPGARLVVGRQSGRIGLLDAVARKTPGLEGLRAIVDHHRRVVHRKFHELGWSVSELHRRLQVSGCNRTRVTVRTWVSSVGPMAPQRLEDLVLLHRVLGTGFSGGPLREVFVALKRYRTLRRLVGRALHKAALRALSPLVRTQKIDPVTGLSVGDLLSAVEVVTVRRVEPCADPVPPARLGYLEEET
jgi:hypothetical protein